MRWFELRKRLQTAKGDYVVISKTAGAYMAMSLVGPPTKFRGQWTQGSYVRQLSEAMHLPKLEADEVAQMFTHPRTPHISGEVVHVSNAVARMAALAAQGFQT